MTFIVYLESGDSMAASLVILVLWETGTGYESEARDQLGFLSEFRMDLFDLDWVTLLFWEMKAEDNKISQLNPTCSWYK